MGEQLTGIGDDEALDHGNLQEGCYHDQQS